MKYKIIIALLVFVCVVGAVSANDNQTDSVLNSNDEYTYNDLEQDILENNELNMSHDYKYDSQKDSKTVINISNDLTINGNGYSIDASNGASAFHIKDSNVFINNLTFKNGIEFMIMAENSNLTFNNVNFIDSEANVEYAIVYPSLSRVAFNNCLFDSNINSCNVYSLLSDTKINNTYFLGKGVWSNMHIRSLASNMSVENCIFENITSNYAPAIYSASSSLIVKNTIFRNLFANYTAGAILIQDGEGFKSENLIENCIFDNITSIKNGGALYFISFEESISKIINSNFTNCTSDFGGAILKLNGNLNISNSNFTDCYANYFGGAIYSSAGTLDIEDCAFLDNAAANQAGAIYCDNQKLTVLNSRFINNKVLTISDDAANTIYNYESELSIEDSLFNNSGISIFSVYAAVNFVNVTFCDDILGNGSSPMISISNNGITLNLVNNTIVVDELPSKFDLRDWGWVTSVKNQGAKGACWAFGAISAMESALLKATGIAYDLSENNVFCGGLIYSIYGDTRNDEGGFSHTALGKALSWYGILPEEEEVYDSYSRISTLKNSENRIHFQDAIIIMPGELNKTIDLIKHAVINYGAVEISYCAEHNEPYYNSTSCAFYLNETRGSDHAVDVVGWDDSYSASNFIITPPGDGAWIIKNSYGSSWGDNGYFYMSYYDNSFLACDGDSKGIITGAVAYIVNNTLPYKTNYQTDFTGLTAFDGNYAWYSNNYVSSENELIGAVGTYFNDTGIDYELRIYVNGKLMHTQSGVSEYPGFKTIILNKYISLKAGDKFKVEFKNAVVPSQFYSRYHITEGMSYVSADGKTWTDYATLNKTVCLKVYTLEDDSKIINNKNIAVDYSGGKYFSVNVVSGDGHPVAGASVKFNINGKTTTVETDSNGIAKIKITQLPKKYTMTTSYNGKTLKNTVTVNQVLTASKVTVKKTAKKFTLKAKLKINGKLVKGKIIKFKFRGKTYKVKTNAKGIAQKTLKKKVIKKLKKGKTYKVKVTYLKDTIKTTVKVKR